MKSDQIFKCALIFCFTVYLLFFYCFFFIKMDLTKFTCGNAESFLPEGNVQIKLTEISTLINVRESWMHMRFKDHNGVFQVL